MMRHLLMFLTASAALLMTAALGVRAEAPAWKVTYFDSAKVSAAFQKGAVLFDGDGGNYMVHASRREAPGMAEVHTKDADIVYVLDGTATLVTGATASDLKNTPPAEFRRHPNP